MYEIQVSLIIALWLSAFSNIRGFSLASWGALICYPRSQQNYRAGPLSCASSFTDSPHHFDSGDYKLRPVMVYHSENQRACYTIPVLFLYTRRFAGKQPPRIARVTSIVNVSTITNMATVRNFRLHLINFTCTGGNYVQKLKNE
jgi:hypothetical protein